VGDAPVAARERRRASGRWRDGTGRVERGSRHTISETSMTTSTRARRIRRSVSGHEVSKPSVIVARWSAERIGPRLIAAPQRGHAHVSTVGASVATGVREKPSLPNPDKAARQDVLDEAAQKLHRGESHRAPLVVVGVVLPLKRGDVVPVERE
jgi:hypothetical protein